MGATGEKGETGSTGSTGVKGEQGIQGIQGIQGVQGQPWTPNNTLPAKATEKGAWSASGVPVPPEPGAASEFIYAPISFTIPLETAPEAHVIESGETTECPGGVAKPEALPGNLCIFVLPGTSSNVKAIASSDPGTGSIGAAGTTGSVLFLVAATVHEGVLAKGTWAVTAE
ncbi:MAG: hypothetical protein ACRDK7_06210 [Solirubrobacteraceae bacterium]